MNCQYFIVQQKSPFNFFLKEIFKITVNSSLRLIDHGLFDVNQESRKDIANIYKDRKDFNQTHFKMGIFVI